MRKHAPDMLMTKPMPSPVIPWVVVVILAVAIIGVKLWALGTPDQLRGQPLPPNEYQHLLQPPAPAPTTGPAAPLEPAPKSTTPAAPSAEGTRVIGQ